MYFAILPPPKCLEPTLAACRASIKHGILRTTQAFEAVEKALKRLVASVNVVKFRPWPWVIVLCSATGIEKPALSAPQNCNGGSATAGA